MNESLSNICTVDNILKVYEQNKFKLFERDDKDYNINIVPIRANVQKAGSFDDVYFVFWKYKGIWVAHKYACTVDPSDLSLVQMKNPDGCAIVKPGQYEHSHKLGYHKGKYEALVQAGPMTVIRDFDKDDQLDWYIDTKDLVKRIDNTVAGITTYNYCDEQGNLIFREQTGIFGINHHRASAYQILVRVGLYSEGCTVVQNPSDYDKLVSYWSAASKLWGNWFTTTYITEQQILKVL